MFVTETTATETTATEVVPLHTLQPGEEAVIANIQGVSALRRRFAEMGILRGATITMHRAAPLGDPIVYSVKGYELALRREEAAQISVRRQPVTTKDGDEE